MDNTLTIETIREARSGDERAAETVLNAMGTRLTALAHSEARRMGSGNTADWVDEFKQVAEIAVWECLQRFEDTTPDAFMAFAYRTASLKVSEAALDERGRGADRDAMKTFGYWVRETSGDIDLAEKLSQRLPDGNGKKLGLDRAHAARLAWQSTVSLDVAFADDAEFSNDDYSFASTLASNLGVPEEYLTPADFDQAKRHMTIEMVRGVLDVMGEKAAAILRGTFGIAPMSLYGTDDNESLGAVLGLSSAQVIDGRKKGKVAFAKRWVPLVSHSDEESASWWEAFEVERQRGNASKTARAAKVAVS